MTARPPTETLEALSDRSGESPAGQAGTGHEANGAEPEHPDRPATNSNSEPSEASISKTLEAILSKSDDEESPFGATGQGVGTKTLLGMSAADLLPRGPSHGGDDGHDGIDIKSEDPVSGVTIDDLFPEQEPAVAKPRASDDTQVGTLLDEVAEALNVQAAASRQRALGRASGAPARRLKPKPDELEFEDPDDGPTSLNAKGDAGGDDRDVGGSSATDDDEEAVVLGPARNSGAHAVAAASDARAAESDATRPLPGTRKPTPFAGLPSATLPTFPTPPGGRSRLPTPAPGQARSTLPPGRPSGAHPTLDGASPTATASGRDSSRRTLPRGSTPASGLNRLEGSGAVVESLAASAMNTASTFLKKDLRLKQASLAAIVVVTFVGGMLLGGLRGGSAKVGSEVAGVKPAPESAAPAAAPAPRPVVAAPVAVPPPAPSNPVESPPAAIPPVAVQPVAVDPGAAATADNQVPRRRPVRRVTPVDVAKDDLPAAKVPAPKSAPRPPAAFPSPPPLKVASKPANGPKKVKAAWHDPFAD